MLLRCSVKDLKGGREEWEGSSREGGVKSNFQPLLSSHALCLSLPPAAPPHQNKRFV